jgi:gliding motility-associated-like protein
MNRVFKLSILLILLINSATIFSQAVIGGASVNGTLKIEVYTGTNFKGTRVQVSRYNSGLWINQWYTYNGLPENSSRGFLLYASGTSYADGHYGISATSWDSYSFSPVVNNSHETTVSITSGLQVKRILSYLSNSSTLKYRYEITNNGGSTETGLRFFSGGDTYMAGDDYGYAFYDVVDDKVGVTNEISGQLVELFFQSESEPSYAYESGSYTTVEANVTKALPALANVANSSLKVDNGYALEWRRNSLAPGDTWVIEASEWFDNKTVSDIVLNAPNGETISPCETKDITFEVENISGSTVSNISLTETIDLAGWTVNVISPTVNFDLISGASQSITVSVTADCSASIGDVAQNLLTASGSGGNTADDVAYISVIAASCSSGAASSTPIVCENTALTAITHSTLAATGISDDGVDGANGLPSGVSASWSGGVITISGTPTSASGSPYSYSIPLTGGGCTTETATGTITVNNCCDLAVTSTPTGETFDCADNGSISLIITGTHVYDVFLDGSATPSLDDISAGPYDITGLADATYSIQVQSTTDSDCDTNFIFVIDVGSSSPTSAFSYTNSPYCFNGIDTVPTLGTGATAGTFSSTAGLVINSTTGEIDLDAGTPATYKVYNTNVVAGCDDVVDSSFVTINPLNTVSAASSTETLCINTLLTSITHGTTGADGIVNDGVSGANGLPLGVSATWVADEITISGTPTESSTSGYSYAIPLTGGCGLDTAKGTITVDSLPLPRIDFETECENVFGSGRALNVDVTEFSASIYPGASGTIIWYDDNSYSSVTNPLPSNETVDSGDVYYFELSEGSCVNQDSIYVSVGSNISLNDPNPTFCADVAGSDSVESIDLFTYQSAIFAGADIYDWDVVGDSSNITITDGDSIRIQVKQGSCPIVDIFVNFSVNSLPSIVSDTIRLCESVTGSGQATFDLNEMNSVVSGGVSDRSVSYYSSYPSSLILSPSSFLSGTATLIAEVKNTLTSCTDTVSVALIVNDLPNVIADTIRLCESVTGSGQATFDLNEMDSVVSGGVSDRIVAYYSSYPSTLISSPSSFFSGTATLIAELENTTTGCKDTVSVQLEVISLPNVSDQLNLEECDSVQLPVITGSLTGNEAYYTSSGAAGVVLRAGDWIDTNMAIIYIYDSTTTEPSCVSEKYFSITINDRPSSTDQSFTLCEDALGSGVVAGIDLTGYNDPSINGGNGDAVLWYDNVWGPILDPTNVTVSNNQTFNVTVNNTCLDSIVVDFAVTGTIDLTDPKDTLCEDSFGLGSVDNVDLLSYESAIFSGGSSPVFVWYQDAGLTTLISNTGDTIVEDGTVFYVEVTDGNCSNNTPVTFTVDSLPDAVSDTISLCESVSGSGQATFDLNEMSSVVSGEASDRSVSYYSSYPSNLILSPSSFSSGTATLIAEVQNTVTNCTDTVSVELIVNDLPAVVADTIRLCEEGSGQATFDLTAMDSVVTGGLSDRSVAYYSDYNSGIAITSPYPSGTVTLIAEVQNTLTSCTDTISVELIVNDLPTVVADTIRICDEGSDRATFDLTTIDSVVTGRASDRNVTYYTTYPTDLVSDPESFISGTGMLIAEVENTLTNCTDTVSVALIVNDLPNVIADTIRLCEEGSGQATFDLTDMNTVVTGGESDRRVTYYSNYASGTSITSPYLSGSATLIAEVENVLTNCSDTISVELIVKPTSFGLVDYTVCSDSNVIVGGTTYNAATPSGTEILIAANGCDSVVTVDLIVLDPITTSLDTTLCEGQTIQVGGDIFGEGNLSGLVVLPAVNGCDSIVTVNVDFAPELSVEVMEDTILCSSDAVILTANSSGEGTVTWYTGASGLNVIGTGSPFELSNNVEGVYTYYVNEDGYCPTDIDSVELTIEDVTALIDANPPTGEIPLEVTFDGSGSTGNIVSYNWDFGNGQIGTGAEGTALYDEISVFTVQLIVSNGTCFDSTTLNIDAFGISSLIIPNVFTPNGDGENDVFAVGGVNMETVNVELFNRWGQKVFSWVTVNGYWDGRTLAGSESPAGTYFYVINAVGADGQQYNKKGSVSLAR